LAPSAPADAAAVVVDEQDLLRAEGAPAAATTAPGIKAPAEGSDDTPVEVVFILRQTAAEAVAAATAPANTATPAATAAPATPKLAPPAGAPIQDSEILVVTVQHPANPSTTNLRVAEDGTIDVPQVGKVKALGRTPAEIEYDIEVRWRQANATAKPMAKAKVVRPGDNPAAEPPPAAASPPPVR
jgi:protein involved in polysaccharide export with SLBB domain